MDLNETTARDLCARILALSKADETTVSVTGSSLLNLRFANNDITTNGVIDDLSISLDVSFGKKSASLSFNRTDQDSLREAVARAEAMARLAPENPEHMPVLPPMEYLPSIAFSDNTAALEPSGAVPLLRPVIEASREAGVRSAGFFERRASASALANSVGLFVFQRDSEVDFSMTARTPEGDGSGWASTQVNDAARLDLETVGRRAIDKALASRHPVAHPPGRTTVILEPAAVRDLVSLLIWHLDRRSVDEERSFLNQLAGNADPVGQKLFGKNVTLFSDPLDPAAPCPTHSHGLPLKRTSWIDAGVLRNLHESRYWAKKNGREPLPGPGNLILEGDGASTEDLIAGVDDGVLITRFWYIRMVEPQTLLHTGLTRDGVFAIRKGKVAEPVMNFRFNESPVNLLRNIVASGRWERVLGSEGAMPMRAPALVVEHFNLSSVSQAS